MKINRDGTSDFELDKLDNKSTPLNINKEPQSFETQELLDEKYKDLYESTNTSGKYQKIMLFLFFVLCLFTCCMMLILPFHKELPEYHCLNKLEFFKNTTDIKKHIDTFKDFQIVHDNHRCIQYYCQDIYPNYTDPSVIVMKIDKKTIVSYVTSLGIMCQFEEFFSSMNLVGFIVRTIMSIVFSYYADTAGRLPCYNILLVILFISHASYYLFKNQFTAYLNISLGMGAFQIYYVAGIAGCEFVGSALASIHCTLQAISCSIMGLIIMSIMWYSGSTDNIYLFNSVGIIVVAVVGRRYVQETPKFLINKKRYRELEEISEDIAKYNETEEEFKRALADVQLFRRTCPAEVLKEGGNDENETAYQKIVGPYGRLFSTKESSSEVLKLTIMCIMLNILYWGMLINADKIGGNMYQNLLMILTGEIISYSIGGYLLLKFDKKPIMYCGYGAACVLSTIVTFVPFGNLKSFFIFLTAFCVSMNYAVMSDYVYSNFEPDVKSTCMSVCMNSAMIALSFLPFMLNQFEEVFTFYAFCAAIATICASMLAGDKIKTGLEKMIEESERGLRKMSGMK